MSAVARDAAEVVRFAREHVGPESERVLSSPEAQSLVLSRLREGLDLQDAVLWYLHREGRSDPRVADEFVAYFLGDLLAIARPALTPGMRRFLDSGDLVQSVLGDLWRDLTDLRFDGRAQFLAFLAQRLRWKVSDQHRALTRDKRREDLRLEPRPDDLPIASADRSPASLAAIHEDWERLALKILRLPERDRLLVRLHLKGATPGMLAEATGLTMETARKALQRALRRLRSLA